MSNDKIRIIIAGSRNFSDYELLRDKMDLLISNMNEDDIQIVSGGCRGADTMGEDYAVERLNSDIKYFPADWKRFGNAAGPRRNREMAEYATHLVLFWDGSSNGSKNMLREAMNSNLKIRQVMI